MRQKHEFCVHEDLKRKILYLEIPRAGCSSIKYELFYKPKYGKDADLKDIHGKLGYKWIKSLKEYRDFFKFAVIRDPFERFMSMCNGAIIADTGRKGWFCKHLGIEHWPIECFSDPNTFIHYVDKEILNRNQHTELQTYLLPADLSELDYIGHLEDMKEVQDKLSKVTGERIVFPQINKSNLNYYMQPVNMDRFYEIFLEDYEAFKDFYSPQKEFACPLDDTISIKKVDVLNKTPIVKALEDTTQIDYIFPPVMSEELQNDKFAIKNWKSEYRQLHAKELIIFTMTKGFFDDLPDESIEALSDKSVQDEFLEFLTREKQSIIKEIIMVMGKFTLLDNKNDLKAKFSQAVTDFMKLQ
jgi:hypothetical protein